MITPVSYGRRPRKKTRNSAVATEVRAIRDNLKMTQEQFAATVGVTRTLLSKWENGDHHPNTAALNFMRSLNKRCESDPMGFFEEYGSFLDRQEAPEPEPAPPIRSPLFVEGSLPDKPKESTRSSAGFLTPDDLFREFDDLED